MQVSLTLAGINLVNPATAAVRIMNDAQHLQANGEFWSREWTGIRQVSQTAEVAKLFSNK